ncbi:MAG: sigma-54 interaction domain-containing protein [Aminipila sp.]
MELKIYEDVIDSLLDPIYILDNEGNFLFANQTIIDITGYTKNDFMHFNSKQLYNDGIIDKCLYLEVFEEKKSKTTIQYIIKKDNLIKKLLVTQLPIFDAKGNVKYIVGHLRDIDKINRLYQCAITDNEVYVMKHSNVDTVKKASGNIVSKSNQMKKLLIEAEKIAAYDTSVLLQGESGTGKEVIANYIHEMGPRKEKEMVSINCASLPEALLEAELFGYVKGAFTGALDTGKEGLIEIAEGGTLFLDEINSLPLATQGKFLRILETKMVKRVGSVKPKYIDFKLIAATNSNLKKLVDEKKFRKDLYYRLNVVPITLPPLRERKEDIIPLTDCFIEHYCNKYGREKKFSKKVYGKLMEYDWPGNIRELKNFVERIILMSSSSVLEIEDTPVALDELITSPVSFDELITPSVAFDEFINSSVQNTEPYEYFNLNEIQGKKLKDAVELFERFIINRVYEKEKSNRKTAEELGVNQSTIIRKINKSNRKIKM